MKAFPISGLSNMTGGQLYEAVYQPGMELRDYFAAEAMCLQTWYQYEENGSNLDAAKKAYAIADAMMEARK